jgi:hypothetical protein
MKEILIAKKGCFEPQAGIMDVYVGRGSALGNPFVMHQESEREQVVEDFRRWLWTEIKFNPRGKMCNELNHLAQLAAKGKQLRLVCYCAPKRCHAEVIAACIKWLIEQGRVSGI